MTDITISKEQLAAVIKIKTDAQDKFDNITHDAFGAELKLADMFYAAYHIGREEAISLALYLMDIR